jgi:hypothetical protein
MAKSLLCLNPIYLSSAKLSSALDLFLLGFGAICLDFVKLLLSLNPICLSFFKPDLDSPPTISA